MSALEMVGIDPGPEISGIASVRVEWVPFGPTLVRVYDATIRPNADVLLEIPQRTALGASVAVERPLGYAQRVGREVIDTAIWAGAFWREAARATKLAFDEMLTFSEVSHRIVGRAGGETEARVWAALVERLGGPDRACGGKRCPACKGTGQRHRERPSGRQASPCARCIGGWAVPPGPLFGVRSHARSAVSVAVAAIIRAGAPFP